MATDGLLLAQMAYNKIDDYEDYDENLKKILENPFLLKSMNELLKAIKDKNKKKIATKLSNLYNLSELMFNYYSNTFFYTIAHFLKKELNMDFYDFLEQIKDIDFRYDLNKHIDNYLNSR